MNIFYLIIYYKLVTAQIHQYNVIYINSIVLHMLYVVLKLALVPSFPCVHQSIGVLTIIKKKGCRFHDKDQ